MDDQKSDILRPKYGWWVGGVLCLGRRSKIHFFGVGGLPYAIFVNLRMLRENTGIPPRI